MSSGPSVIQFCVLESMAPALLERLAARLAGSLGASHEAQDVAAWLYEAATRDDLAQSAREMLDGVAALASEDGAEVLLSAGLERSTDLAQEYGPRSCADLAVLACLQHQDVFADARAQVRAVNHRLFAVYVCKTRGFLSKAGLMRSLPRFESAVSAWLRRRGRPDGCRAIVTGTGGQLVLDVVTQRTPSRCIAADGAEVLASAKRQDTIVFDCEGASAAIHARSAADVEFYRELIGVALLADKEAYRASHVFRLRRLLSPTEWEPRVSLVPGLIKVLLRSVEVQSGVQRTRWRGESDLCARRRAVAEQLESADECTRVELEFHSQGRAYPCAVEILSPNRICLDQRAIGPMASSYLKARGLFVAA